MELYIDTGNGILNKEAFDSLLADRAAIEAEIGDALSWERLESARASRIAAHHPGQVTDVDPLRREHLEWCADMLNKFRLAFGDRVRQTQLSRATAMFDSP